MNKGDVMRKNWFVTAGGFIGMFSGLPVIWGTAVKDGAVHTAMPGWLYLICVCALPVSLGIIGIGAKGQDQHSTFQEVEKSSTTAPTVPPAPQAPPVQ